MLSNAFKVAIRNLMKYRGFSFINITGLAVGLAVTLLIAVFVQHELTYDFQQSKHDRIYRVVRDFLDRDGTVSLRLSFLAPAFTSVLREEFPEIEEVVRGFNGGGWLVQNGDRKIYSDKLSFADANIFKVFDVGLIVGDPATALQEPYTLILSQSMALQLFGEENPLGKSVLIDGKYPMKVTGVFRDQQSNTIWHYNVLASFKTLEVYMREVRGRDVFTDDNWGNNSYMHWVLLKPGTDWKALERKFDGVLDKRIPAWPAEDGSVPKPSSWTHLYLQPLTSIHLHSHRDSEIEPTSDIRIVMMLVVIALFILALACVNFINLATARSASRAREVGLRKVIGAARQSLVFQYMIESTVITVIAAAIAVLLVSLVLPSFSTFVGIQGKLSLMSTSELLLLLLATVLVTGFAAGLYPALYLSGFTPIRILRGELTKGKGGARLRRVLVVFQYVVSITLLIGVGVVFRQLNYMRNSNLGFNKEQVITLGVNNGLYNNWPAVKFALARIHGVVSVTESSRIPSGRLRDANGGSLEMPNGEMKMIESRLADVRIDQDFFKTFGVPFVAGRDLSVDFPADSGSSFILNEAAVNRFNLGTPSEVIGRRIQYGGHDGTIVGVVKDFHFESMHQSISPVVFYLPKASGSIGPMSIRIAPEGIRKTLAEIKAIWNEYDQTFPFDYTFLDEQVDRQYRTEQRLMALLGSFSLFAVFVASLGLFGLAAFTAERRTKEIGIRRTLGATTVSVIQLLSGEFTKLVLISNVIAWPIAGYAMYHWLRQFPYHVSLSPWIFLGASLLALAIALGTVMTQAARVARTNPVDALRYE